MRRLFCVTFVGMAIVVSCGGRTTGDGVGDPAGAAGNNSGATGGAGGSSTGGKAGGGTGGTTPTTGGGTTVGVGGTGGGTTGGTSTGSGGAGAIGGTGGVGGSGGFGGNAIDPGPEFSSCVNGESCQLEATKCCPCGTLDQRNLAAVATSKGAAYGMKACPPPIPPCNPCLASLDPHVVARCESNRCVGFDIRSDPKLTACTADSDCGASISPCCTCSAGSQSLVAANQSGLKALSELKCQSSLRCANCGPLMPTGRPQCRAGVCEFAP